MADVNTLTGKITDAPKTAPTPATQGAPAAQEPASQGGPNQEAALRRLSQKAKTFEQENLSLRERLARVEGQLSGQSTAPTAKPTPNSWGDLDDKQLDQAIAHGISESKPETVTAAINEKVARAAAMAAKSAHGVSTREYEEAKLKDTIRAQIHAEFGQEATNEDSSLYQAADRHYAALCARYGKETVKANPDMTRYAFTLADRELHAGERDQAKQVAQENERLKRQMQLERGGVLPGVPRSQESADALAKGDLKGAIRGLGIFKDVKQDIEKRYR